MTSKDTSPTLASTRAQKSSVMSLQNILNDDQSLTSPSSDEDSWPRPPVDKKETTLQKKAPDGPVHFLPHDIGNDPQMLSLFERHTVWPRKDLGSWSEFIPYNMEKNALKLGRNHLCVYGMVWTMPEYEVGGTASDPATRTWYGVYWDYQTGLVRMTNIFKSCKYRGLNKKTTPKKALERNPGLERIAISVTGGAIKGQGYYIPMAAAKALAAKFAYSIRHLLVPVFGPDFPDLCERINQNGTELPDLTIDPAIIKQCMAEVAGWQTNREYFFGPTIDSDIENVGKKKRKANTKTEPTETRQTRRKLNGPAESPAPRVRASTSTPRTGILSPPSAQKTPPQTTSTQKATRSSSRITPARRTSTVINHGYPSPTSPNNAGQFGSYNPMLDIFRARTSTSRFPFPGGYRPCFETHISTPAATKEHGHRRYLSQHESAGIEALVLLRTKEHILLKDLIPPAPPFPHSDALVLAPIMEMSRISTTNDTLGHQPSSPPSHHIPLFHHHPHPQIATIPDHGQTPPLVRASRAVSAAEGLMTLNATVMLRTPTRDGAHHIGASTATPTCGTLYTTPPKKPRGEGRRRNTVSDDEDDASEYDEERRPRKRAKW